MLTLIPLGFMLGAVAYAALAVWRALIGGRGTNWPLLVLAFAAMAAWNVAALTGGAVVAVLAEVARNLAWIAYLYAIMRHDGAVAERRMAWLPGLLVAAAVLRAVLVLVFARGGAPGWVAALAISGCSLAFCIGALVFIQSLYFAAHRGASGFRLILFALALMWAYDLNLYAMLLQFQFPLLLAQGRGLLGLALAPLFGVAARRKRTWSIALSRGMTFQSLSVVAIGGYFVFAAAVASARPWLGSHAQAAAQIAGLLTVSAAALVLLASRRARAEVKVFVSKHLFEHRYDYRAEWLRFNATINSGGLVGLSPDQRAVKALADLMDAAGGLMFLRDGRDALVCAARFERAGAAPVVERIALSHAWLEQMEEDGHVLVSPLHGGEAERASFPPELRRDGGVWLLVPLVRLRSLVGLVALGAPRARRQLDWEDFDLLKVLGQQIATYVADAHAQAELEQARQFEEFNRRFAFIVHDIKNVVSQLSLVAANAQEHGANPRFQADMASTLRNSVTKMTTLLSRLSQGEHASDVAIRPVDADALLHELAAARRAQHPVTVEPGDAALVLADRAKLVTALDHLVQNAIEASGPAAAVTLRARAQGTQAVLVVRDAGRGMSSEFVRHQLFRPFASTKPAGFGIGAGEARTLVRQMGGELEVASSEGAGTSFFITLPIAGPTAGATTRMAAPTAAPAGI